MNEKKDLPPEIAGEVLHFYDTVCLLCDDMLLSDKLTPEQGALWDATRVAAFAVLNRYGYENTREVRGGTWDRPDELGKPIKSIAGSNMAYFEGNERWRKAMS